MGFPGSQLALTSLPVTEGSAPVSTSDVPSSSETTKELESKDAFTEEPLTKKARTDEDGGPIISNSQEPSSGSQANFKVCISWFLSWQLTDNASFIAHFRLT